MRQIKDYKAFLSQTLSRKEIVLVVLQLATEPEQMDEILRLLKDSDRRTAWHAAWALQKFFEKYPEALSWHVLDILTERAVNADNESMRRITFSVVAAAGLPEELPVPLINHSFDWILSADTSIAVKALSIHYLLKVCKREPDLLPELKMCVRQLLEVRNAPAFRSVAKKVLKD